MVRCSSGASKDALVIIHGSLLLQLSRQVAVHVLDPVPCDFLACVCKAKLMLDCVKLQSRLLRDPPLVVEAHVLGPSDEELQSRSSTPYRAQAMPQAQKYQHSRAHTTRDGSVQGR